MNAATAGLALAFVSAVAVAGRNLYNKQHVEETDEFLTAWAMKLFPLPIMGAALFIVGLPDIGAAFWWAFPLNLVTGVIGSICITKAFKYADVSVATPLFSLKPAFLLVTSPIILGEMPGPSGYIGVILIVVGAYMLNIQKLSDGPVTPLKSLLRNRGAQYVFLIVAMGGVMYNVSKIGVQSTSPFFWAFVLYAGLLIALTPIMIHKTPDWRQQVQSNFRGFATLGIFIAVNILAQYVALELTFAMYVSAIKQFSAVLGVFAGVYFLGESGFKRKVISAAVMVVGVVFITVL